MRGSAVQASIQANSGGGRTSLTRTGCPFVAALRARRQQLGLSQEEVAGRIGVVDYLVRWWEAGHRVPSITTAMAWAQVLDCRLVLLLIDTPPGLRDPAQDEGGGQKPAASTGPGLARHFSARQVPK